METELHKVLVYANGKGSEPFVLWLEGLKNREDLARIKTRVHRLELGNFGDCESVGGGVHEMKLHFGPGYRVYFGKIGKRVVLLLQGGTKGNQQGDIAKAKEYWIDYKGRK